MLSELLREHLDAQREQAAKLVTSLARIEARIGALERGEQGGASAAAHASPPATEGVQRPSDPEDVLAHLDDEEQKVIKAASASSVWLDRARLSAAAGPTVGDDGSRLEEDSFVHRHARLVDEGLKAQPSPKQLLQRVPDDAAGDLRRAR